MILTNLFVECGLCSDAQRVLGIVSMVVEAEG